MNSSILGGKIRHIRELRNLTQDHMARQLGMDQSQYSKIETGRTRPTEERLEMIAKILDIPLAELLNPLPLVLHMNSQPVTHAAIDHQVKREQHLANEEFMRTMISKMDQQIHELTRMNGRLTDLLERQLDN
jgi:transcriptional regulator with XRE-family HTH domain